MLTLSNLGTGNLFLLNSVIKTIKEELYTLGLFLSWFFCLFSLFLFVCFWFVCFSVWGFFVFCLFVTVNE